MTLSEIQYSHMLGFFVVVVFLSNDRHARKGVITQITNSSSYEIYMRKAAEFLNRIFTLGPLI